MSLITSLKWRYAAKKYSNQKVSDADIKTILEAINLSATSAGLQPFRVIVVENPEIRKSSWLKEVTIHKLQRLRIYWYSPQSKT
jgi:nitroreductase